MAVTLIVDVIIIGLLAIFYFVYATKYYDIHTIVIEGGVERHTLDMGQVLLSYSKLIYIENDPDIHYTRFYRGVFVKENLDKNLCTSPGTEACFNKDASDIPKELGYPNSAILLYVKDFQTGRQWILPYTGPSGTSGLVKDFGCLESKTRTGIDMLFRIPPISPWETYDVMSCLSSDASSYGGAVRSFPVAIKDGNSVHAGVLRITIFEWW